MDNTSKVDPVNTFMYVYKEKIQSDGNIDKLNFIIVVKGYLKNKDMVGYTWPPIAFEITMKYLL